MLYQDNSYVLLLYRFLFAAVKVIYGTKYLKFLFISFKLNLTSSLLVLDSYRFYRVVNVSGKIKCHFRFSLCQYVDLSNRNL